MRVYVARSRFDEAVDALRAAMGSIRVGDPRAADTDIGPLISGEHRQAVHGFVSRALAAGAEALTGGRPLDGPGAAYPPPTLVVGAAQGSEIVQGEVFGPVLVVLPVADDEEALLLVLQRRVVTG